MLYLAQVHKNEFLDQYQLRLLARQEAEYFWGIIPEEAFILLGKSNSSEVKRGNPSQSDDIVFMSPPTNSPPPESGYHPSPTDHLSQRIPFRLTEKMLVLVELSATGEIEWVEEATNWVLNLVQTFLTTGITPDSLRQEAQQAEQWRQNLTLQSQDLARRSLELEARREQIQSLEESIKREQNDNNAARDDGNC